MCPEIPAHDPRNPASVADAVGDNVGDVGGIGADLFESYVCSIIAAATQGQLQYSGTGDAAAALALPFWLTGAGVVAALGGIMFVTHVKVDNGTPLHRLLRNVRYGWLITAGLVLVLAIGACVASFSAATAWSLAGCVAMGLLCGAAIALYTE